VREAEIHETVKAQDLWKVYRVGPIEYVALRGVTLTIPRGEFTAVVGPSGSGKTTFLNLLGALDRPTRGEVLLDGVPLSRLKDNELAALRNRKMGFIFQSYNLVPYLTASENVQLPMLAANIPPGRRREKADTLLAQLGLGDKLDKKPNELSGGEQQRVAIARALVNDPTLILADEPTGNIDSVSAHTVASLLRDITRQRGVTTVMVTHNMEITKYCDRIVYLRDGAIEREVRMAS
jgi:putative ABC transport system ATP-binding protein